MNNVLFGDFKTVATEIITLVFPKTDFKVLCQEIGIGNIAITFYNPKNFSDNFRIKYYVKLRTLIISGYSNERTVNLIYQTENNYSWRNESGLTINKPCSIGEKLELLAMKFLPILQEFYLGRVFENFSISHDLKTVSTSIADRTFFEFTQN